MFSFVSPCQPINACENLHAPENVIPLAFDVNNYKSRHDRIFFASLAYPYHTHIQINACFIQQLVVHANIQ